MTDRLHSHFLRYPQESLYRNSGVRRGDRVVVRTLDGEVLAKVLIRRTARTVELESLNKEHSPLVLPLNRIEWMARIIWASQ